MDSLRHSSSGHRTLAPSGWERSFESSMPRQNRAARVVSGLLSLLLRPGFERRAFRVGGKSRRVFYIGGHNDEGHTPDCHLFGVHASSFMAERRRADEARIKAHS